MHQREYRGYPHCHCRAAANSFTREHSHKRWGFCGTLWSASWYFTWTDMKITRKSQVAWHKRGATRGLYIGIHRIVERISLEETLSENIRLEEKRGTHSVASPLTTPLQLSSMPSTKGPSPVSVLLEGTRLTRDATQVEAQSMRHSGVRSGGGVGWGTLSRSTGLRSCYMQRR